MKKEAPKYAEKEAPKHTDEFVSWFRRNHRNLETSTSKPVSFNVGSAAGKRIQVKYTSKPDVTAVRTSSKPENHPLDLCGVFDCVPLFPFPKSISYRGMASFDKVKGKDRFVIADVGGKPVVIYISAPTAGKAHEFFRRRGRC